MNLYTRRHFLRIGSLGLAGLSLPAFSRGEAGGALEPKVKSCILLFYYGGPCQLDPWDMKSDAPAEVRGEFRPIATCVTGLRICEHLPKTARVTDKIAVIRSMHHPMRNHNSAAVEALCGRTPLKGDLELLADDPNSFPNYGAVLSYVSPIRGHIPAHVALPHVMYNVVVLPGQTAGFLGAAYNHFQVAHDPTAADFHVSELALPADLPLVRLEDRHSLLTLSDGQVARADRRVRARSMDVYQKRAFGLLRSDEVRRAFDLPRESTVVRERYGRTRLGQSLLLARRLVEAGVRVGDGNADAPTGWP